MAYVCLQEKNNPLMLTYFWLTLFMTTSSILRIAYTLFIHNNLNLAMAWWLKKGKAQNRNKLVFQPVVMYILLRQISLQVLHTEESNHGWKTAFFYSSSFGRISALHFLLRVHKSPLTASSSWTALHVVRLRNIGVFLGECYKLATQHVTLNARDFHGACQQLLNCTVYQQWHVLL
jgi:hypothetical protein